ncbi:MAG: type 1 glutamine amidotransferase domain-containing protein [Promethearchaeota archaeon]
MKLRGKRIAIFVEDLYEEFELWYPYYRMKEEGAEVSIVGPRIDTFKGKSGIPAKADNSIYDIKSDDYDALIIPGGYSPDRMRRNQRMVEFVKEMYDKGKIVAGICHGGWMLASANIVKGKKITSFFSIKDDLINAGAKWIDKEVVQDGNIITSRKPDDLPAFCRTIIEALR